MIDAIDLLQTALEPILRTGFFVFLRVGAAMALLPAFGEQSVPVRVRLGIGLAFTAIVFPQAMALVGDTPLGPATAGAEIGAGLFLGILLRFFVFALQMAGSIAAQSTSLSQIFGGSAGNDPQPAIGHLLTIGGLALAVMLGLHVRLAAYLIDSYSFLPFGRIPSPGLVAELGLERIGRAFAQAFSLSAPFVVAALIYNIMLGVINRAMPQLMVSFVGAPAITLGALALLAIAMPLMLGLWVDGLNAFLTDPGGGF